MVKKSPRRTNKIFKDGGEIRQHRNMEFPPPWPLFLAGQFQTAASPEGLTPLSLHKLYQDQRNVLPNSMRISLHMSFLSQGQVGSTECLSAKHAYELTFLCFPHLRPAPRHCATTSGNLRRTLTDFARFEPGTAAQ
jgi:hypothetical protein